MVAKSEQASERGMQYRHAQTAFQYADAPEYLFVSDALTVVFTVFTRRVMARRYPELKTRFRLVPGRNSA